MATENEPAKLILPYLQRADELQKHEPLVAYYCRLYAMERGLKIPPNDRTKTTNALLVSLMKQLEKDKKSLTLGPDDHLHLEGFALNVFSKADKQDRAGRADLNTAKTFYAASIFFEILYQFGELQPDLEQKQKYAAWKAADIRKALKEGRKPVAGPPGGEDDPSLESRASSGEYDLEPSRDPTISPNPSRENMSTTIRPVSNSSPQQYDHLESTSFMPHPQNITPSPSNISTPPQYPEDSPSNKISEQSRYPDVYHSASYHGPPYQSEPQHLLPQHYSSEPQHLLPQPYSYTNFQSSPSFSESSLPAAPPHYPSYYQGSDASYSHLQPANAADRTPNAQYDSVPTRNGSVPEPSPAANQKYEYDSNFEPPPEQVAEAQKAARFAVGALAFDDVFVAVDHLKKALELLTKPSGGH